MSGYLITANEIGKYMHRSERTVRRWIKFYGFPAFKTHHGWITNPALIDGWILERMNTRYE